jgi:antitoxin (DNA-binding transcriptional repressor) of toxin-antitoxin stability system
MDEVAEQGVEITITKHNRPVAKLAPVRGASRGPLFGRMKGTMRIRGDLVAPISPDWEVDADL